MHQRGSGRSTPRGETSQNTLLELVNDCEKLRQHVGISHWNTVLGGSWGVTVTVTYAQEYPESVQSILLRVVCLFRQPEINWMFANSGYAQYHDLDAWKLFSSAVDSLDGSPRETLYGYYGRLLGNNPNLRTQAARSWMPWEMKVYTGQSSNFYETAYAPVAVYNGGVWSWRDGVGQPFCQTTLSKLGISSLCENAVHKLQQPLPSSLIDDADDDSGETPRPVRPIPAASTSSATVDNSQTSSALLIYLVAARHHKTYMKDVH